MSLPDLYRGHLGRRASGGRAKMNTLGTQVAFLRAEHPVFAVAGLSHGIGGGFFPWAATGRRMAADAARQPPALRMTRGAGLKENDDAD